MDASELVGLTLLILSHNKEVRSYIRPQPQTLETKNCLV